MVLHNFSLPVLLIFHQMRVSISRHPRSSSLFLLFRIFFCSLRRPGRMLRRSIHRIQSQRCTPDIAEIVPGTSRYDHRASASHSFLLHHTCPVLSYRYYCTAFCNTKKLIGIFMTFQPDFSAGRYAHQRDLKIISRPDRSPETGIPSGQTVKRRKHRFRTECSVLRTAASAKSFIHPPHLTTVSDRLQ